VKFCEQEVIHIQAAYYSLIPITDFLFYIKYSPLIWQIYTGFSTLFSTVDTFYCIQKIQTWAKITQKWEMSFF